MQRRMTWKEFLFILPLLLLVLIFSLYPILSSFVYTLFDYQTNNQTKNALYTGATLNASLYAEDCEYLAHYLKKDLATAEAADQPTLTALMETLVAQKELYANSKQTLSLSAASEQEISALIEQIRDTVTSLAARYPDFRVVTKGPQLLNEMETCLVSSNYVGLANYARLTADTRFGQAVGNTFEFTVISVAVELVLGMALALIMNKAMRGIGLVRTTALIPWAIPTAVSALIWCYLYDGTSGVVAALFTRLGLIASPELLLTTQGGTMFSAILADVWKTTPYMALLLLAGLQVIDRGLYESSAIDGAGAVRTFTSITLPLLKPSMLVALLFRTLDAFRVYDLIAVLTKGTPETLSIYAYKMMIGQSNYGYGSVIVVAMFVLVALIAFVYVKVLGAELIRE
ncbi:MAG TPA: sugar ABC transporter permease [Candidatus Limiplasma sp.]|nr:sugar ABC transporter permease [Candidatus Limiplasma sp.]HPS81395.1 sugar ABC transporter permease [Candidatus Limiplasma sp.]